MKVLVTGSSGFIARFLVPALAESGHTVVGIDKRTGPGFGEYFQFVHGNILDEAAVARSMEGVEAIFHLAAEHKDFGVTEEMFNQVNVDGTQLLLDHATKSGIRKFVFYSSVAVYGDCAVPTNESLEPNPESFYGKSKLLAEQRIKSWCEHDHSRQSFMLRPTVVFGPENFANMYRLIQSLAKRRYLAVGDGSNIKSIAYVENVVGATLFLFERMESGVQIYNYADTPQLATKQLVHSIANNLGISLPGLHIPKSVAMACAFPFDLIARLTGADLPITAKRIDKFTSSTQHEAGRILETGFRPAISMEEGIKRTTDWFLAGAVDSRAESNS